MTTLRRDIYAVFRGRGMEPDLAGPAIADLPDPGRSPEQEVTARDQDAQVGAALQRLPARDRELLTLLMDSPAPRYSDVSARLKMPVGSIGPGGPAASAASAANWTPPASTASWSVPSRSVPSRSMPQQIDA